MDTKSDLLERLGTQLCSECREHRVAVHINMLGPVGSKPVRQMYNVCSECLNNPGAFEIEIKLGD